MLTKRAGAVAAGVLLLLSAAGVVFSQRPSTPSAPSTPKAGGGSGVPLVKRLAIRTKLPEKTVKELLDALAPEIQAEIQRGGVEILPKLGKIRIVRIPEHKDMERGTGRVLTVPGNNYVIFDPDNDVATAANGYQVVPNEVVPQFQYNVMPGQTPSQKAGSLKVRSIRTP